MPKSDLLGITKSKILSLLRERKSSAKEIATALDIQVSAVRKHLEFMIRTGVVRFEYVNEGVGRPKKFYALTEPGRELLPTQYSNVLSIILAKMLRDKETWRVEALMKEVAEDFAGKIREQVTEPGKNLDKLTTSLDKLGFETTIEEKDGHIVVISRNCPVYRIASTHKGLVCEHLHANILKSALDTDRVELKECVIAGAGLCRHHIAYPRGDIAPDPNEPLTHSS